MIDKHVALCVVIINELFLTTVSLLADFHRHRVCEPRFSLAYEVACVAYTSASSYFFVVRFTVSRLVNKFVLKN